MIPRGSKGNSDTRCATLHTVYDVPWLRAVPRKLSSFLQTWCFGNLVVPTTSNREVFIQTAVQEPDHWTISMWLLEVFPPALPFVPGGSQSTNRASCFTSHVPQYATCPGCAPLPPSLLTGIHTWILTGSASNRTCKDRRGTGEGLCWAPRSRTASRKPTNTLVWRQRPKGPAAIPVLEHNQESFYLFKH